MVDFALVIDDAPNGWFEITTNSQGVLMARASPLSGISGNDGRVQWVLFVDPTYFTIGDKRGTILHPFESIGEALAYATTQLYPELTIMLAPGIYSDDVTVASAAASPFDTLQVTSWPAAIQPISRASNIPRIDGDWTIGAEMVVNFANLFQVGAITADAPEADTITVSFDHARCVGAITSNILQLNLTASLLFGDITANADLSIDTDGYSWASMIAIVDISPAGYNRRFRDTGSDAFSGSLVANGLAINGTADVAVSFPGLRANEWVIPTLTAPDTNADFTATFAYSVGDTAHFTLHNISRNPGDFNEAVYMVAFHGNVTDIPIP